jgi:hypothetical protein
MRVLVRDVWTSLPFTRLLVSELESRAHSIVRVANGEIYVFVCTWMCIHVCGNIRACMVCMYIYMWVSMHE